MRMHEAISPSPFQHRLEVGWDSAPTVRIFQSNETLRFHIYMAYGYGMEFWTLSFGHFPDESE